MKHVSPSFDPGYGAYSYSPEDFVGPEMDQTRQQFLGLNDMQKDMLDPYASMLMGYVAEAGHMRPSDHLAVSEQGEFGVFLAQHHAYLEMQQADPHLKEVFDFYKYSYLDRLEEGVQEGWVSADARDTFRTIAGVELEVGDMRETRLQWKVGQFTGYNNHMIIAQGIRGDGDYRGEVTANIRDSAPHELSHRFSRWLPRWASESLAEQLGLVVQHGDPETFHANLRAHEKSAFYNAESALMHTVLTEAPNQNPELPLLALRAFTSKSPESGEWKRFYAALDTAWGTTDVFRKVSDHVDGLEKSIAIEEPDWSNWQVEPEASTRTMYTLMHDQTKIFGRDYKPGGRHRREPETTQDRQGGRHRKLK
jgi:hypothetical protein